MSLPEKRKRTKERRLLVKEKRGKKKEKKGRKKNSSKGKIATIPKAQALVGWKRQVVLADISAHYTQKPCWGDFGLFLFGLYGIFQSSAFFFFFFF